MIKMLKIDKLKFSYNNREILKKIDLYLEEREFVGIIGPNGSGKTTLLKNISRILSPDSGVIYLNQKLLNSYDTGELARFMAVVPQDTAVNYNFTVYDLIMMGRNPYQDRWGRVKKEDKEIVEEVMELTDTVEFRDKRINELSGGERQRVIIARALAQKPRVLLLDEPTASLDINYQREIFDLLASLNKDLDLTVIVVSHDLNLSSQYCSKLVLLKDGKIFKVGKPEEVLTARNIKEVYHTEVVVKNNPLTGRPFIIMVPKVQVGVNSRKQDAAQTVNPKRIHVICGGGTGKKIINLLYNQGYIISCGVLNQGDADWEVAKKLGLKVAEIPPFVHIDRESLKYNRQLINCSDLVIVTDTPFGPGNLPNIALLTEIDDINIVLIEGKGIKDRDYTGGEAEKYWNKLVVKKHTHVIETTDKAFEFINKLVSP